MTANRIRCAHCKDYHLTVAAVKLCSIRHGSYNPRPKPKPAETGATCTDCSKPATAFFAPSPSEMVRVPFCTDCLPSTRDPRTGGHLIA